MKTEIMTEDWMVDVPRATPATIPVPESAPFAPTEGERLRARQLGRIEAWAEDLKAFFGAKAERLVSCSLTFALGDYLMAQRAIAALLHDWRIEREAAYDRFRPERPAILERRVVKTGPRSYDYAIAEGRQFWVGPQGTRLVIGLKLNEDRKEPSSDMTFFVPADGY
ncbi:hypothetical protein HYR69_11240, partial [Candidatus Sumerlaeota bacterium]|nr:hypothetical protein [Candidatus Sumerlaeota bacterium]